MDLDVLLPFHRVDKYLEDVLYDDIYRKKIKVDHQAYRSIKYTVKRKHDDLIKRMPELEGIF